MSIRVGNKVIVGGAAIASVDEPGVMRPDGQTIDINEDIISVLAVKDQNKQDISNIKFWTGTLQEYNNLGQWDDNTLYNIIDDAPTTQEGIPLASQHNYGIVKVDGETIYSNNGVLTAHTTEEYTLPVASTNTLGGVKVDGETITILDGVISAISNGSGGAGGWEFAKGTNSGYLKHIDSGLIIQFGRLTLVSGSPYGSATSSATFPTPFTTTNISVTTSFDNDMVTEPDNNVTINVSGISIKHTTYAYSTQMHYIAMGY